MRINGMLSILLSFILILAIPFIFRWINNIVEPFSSLKIKSRVMQIIMWFVFVFAIAITISFLAPGSNWVDSPYLLIVLALLSISWGTEQTHILFCKYSIVKGQTLNFQIQSPIKWFLSSTLNTFLFVMIIYALTFIFLFYKKGTNIWLCDNFLFACSTIILFGLAAMLGSILAIYLMKKEKADYIVHFVKLLSFLWGISLFLNFLFPDNWREQLLSLHQKNLILWGVAVPSVCFLILSGFLLRSCTLWRIK